MSTLLQQILLNDVPATQTIRINKDVNIAHIRPWVYIQGTIADGELKLEVLQDTTVLSEQTIAAAQLNSAKTEDFSHGFIRFDFDSLQLNVPEGSLTQEYIIRLSITNHTYDPSNFVAWNRDWEDSRYTVYGDIDINGDPVNDSVAPYAIEIYAWENN